MNIKQAIEAEAKKAGEAIRDALQVFAGATGMRADIDIQWLSWQHVEEASNANSVARVRVSVAGMEVEA